MRRISSPRIPTLTTRGLLVYLVFLMIFALNIFGNTDPDFWWHLRTGQYIVETQSIPKLDVFSYTFEGQPRVPQEWASEVLLFYPFQAFGYAGDVVLFSGIVTLTLFLVYRLCRGLGANSLVSALLIFWGALLARPSFTARPQVFTWLFFAVFLSSLYLYHRGLLRRLWHLPVLMVLWVNLHGGFVIGLGLIVLLLLARLGERRFMRQPVAIRHLLVVLGLSVAATLVSPNGLNGLSYPLTYAGFANPSARFILEWQSPNFHEPYWLVLLASILLLMALGVANRSLGAWPVSLIAVLATMALQSTRHIPLYAISMAPVLAETLALRLKFPKSDDLSAPRRPLSRLNWLLLLFMTAGAVGLAVNSPASQLRRLPVTFRGMPYPEAGTEYIRANYPKARMFNEYVWGGYIIYSLFPTQRVFVDGRADLYSSKFLNDYNSVVALRPDWKDVLDRYEVDLVFIQKQSPLSVVLSDSPSWEKVFSGNVEDIFVRRGVTPDLPEVAGLTIQHQ